MKSSCVAHPKNTRIAILREEYLRICDNHVGAAFLLSFFEYWHNIKIAQSGKAFAENNIQEKHGDSRTQNEYLYQFHTQQEISESLLGSVGRPSIESGEKILIAKGFLTVHRNPNPRYKFDRTKYFMFYPEIVNSAIEVIYDTAETATTISRNCMTVGQKLYDSGAETVEAITEITNKTTTEYINPLTPLRGDICFSEFWKIYPKRKGKEYARKAWWKLKPDNQLCLLIFDAVEKQQKSEEWQKDGGKYIPHPATWLNGRRWEDEITQAGPKMSKSQQNLKNYLQRKEDRNEERGNEQAIIPINGRISGN